MIKDVINKIYKQGELVFYWKAYKKDGTVFSQFEKIEGIIKENLFTDLNQHPENYEKFVLVSADKPEIFFGVDLITGDFELNKVLIKNNIDVSNQQLKCIFWRRKAITLNLIEAKESSKYLYYLLGWHTNIRGADIKKEYKIFSDFSVQEILHKQSRKLYAKGKIVKII